MSYKNRQRAGWASRKETKENIHKERRYAKEEVKQALQEEHEGEDYRYHTNNKKKFTGLEGKIHKAENKLRREKKTLRFWARYDNDFGDKCSWQKGILNRIKHDIKKYTEKLKNLLTSN